MMDPGRNRSPRFLAMLAGLVGLSLGGERQSASRRIIRKQAADIDDIRPISRSIMDLPNGSAAYRPKPSDRIRNKRIRLMHSRTSRGVRR